MGLKARWTKDHVLHDPIYVKCPEEGKLETESKCLEPRQDEGPRRVIMKGVFFEVMGRFYSWVWWWLHMSANILKTIALDNLNGWKYGMWITSIKPLFLKCSNKFAKRKAKETAEAISAPGVERSSSGPHPRACAPSPAAHREQNRAVQYSCSPRNSEPQVKLFGQHRCLIFHHM